MAVGNEKAPKEIICPGCGSVIKNTAFNPITDTCGAMLQDGWLCPECAYRLRPKYPMHYTDDEPVTLKRRLMPAGPFSPCSGTTSSMPTRLIR